jgi:hypothetical protein
MRFDLFKHLATLVAIGVILLFYGLSIVDYVAPAVVGSEDSESFRLLVAANRLALIVMLVHGSLVHSPNFKLIALALGLILVGGIMKILHVPGADYVIPVVWVLIGIIYIFHFYSKNNKVLLDSLKLIVVMLLANPLEVVLPYQFLIHYTLVSEIFCAITFIYFLYAERAHYMRNPND